MLAIFDLDETLIQGNCTTLWCEWMCEQGLIANIDDFLAEEIKIVDTYQHKICPKQESMTLIFSPIRHLSIQIIHSLIAQFIQIKIAPKIYQAGFSLTRDHLKNGDDVLIISASPHIFVKKIAEQFFNVKNVFGIKIMDENNHYTGEITGTIPYQSGKITLLNQYINMNDLHPNEVLNQSYFYSASINDLPLLELVPYPNVVNPDGALALIAESQNWPILKFTTLLK